MINILCYLIGNMVLFNVEVNEQIVKVIYKDYGIIESNGLIKEGNGLMGIRECVVFIYVNVDIFFVFYFIVIF